VIEQAKMSEAISSKYLREALISGYDSVSLPFW